MKEGFNWAEGGILYEKGGILYEKERQLRTNCQSI